MDRLTARDARRLMEEMGAHPHLTDIRRRIEGSAAEGDDSLWLPTAYFPADAEVLARILRILERDGFSLSLSSETLTISWR